MSIFSRAIVAVFSIILAVSFSSPGKSQTVPTDLDMTKGARPLTQPSDVTQTIAKLKKEQAERDAARKKAEAADALPLPETAKSKPLNALSSTPGITTTPEVGISQAQPKSAPQNMAIPDVTAAPPIGVSPIAPKPVGDIKHPELPDANIKKADDIPNPLGKCNTADLNQLLTPACMDELNRIARQSPSSGGVPLITQAPLPAPAMTSVTQCLAVLIPPGGMPGAPMPFSAPSYEQCYPIGAQMTYGFIGTVNIVAMTQQWGPLAVSCRRPAEDGGQTISCSALQ